MSRTVRPYRRALSLALLLGALVLTAGLTTPAAAGQASRGSWTDACDGFYGQTCVWWKATVTQVIDGDTVEADVKGDGEGPVRVRLIGINATEIAGGDRARDDCHAREAKAALAALIDKSNGQVRLSSIHPDSRGTSDRLLRSLAYQAGGQWQDAGEVLLARGHTLWFTKPAENAHYDPYGSIVDLFAAPQGLNLWDTDFCGVGPHQNSQLEVRVQYDENGPERSPLNAELVQVVNHNARTDVSLSGWRVRAGGNDVYRFPRGTVVRAGHDLVLSVGGERPAGPVDLVWPIETATLFSNGYGDGVYLFDPDGDLRAYQLYGCFSCSPRYGTPPRIEPELLWTTDSLVGSSLVTISNPDSAKALDLDGTYLEFWQPALRETYTYTFVGETRLAPGEQMLVHVVRDRSLPPESRLNRYWYIGEVAPDAGIQIHLLPYDKSYVHESAHLVVGQPAT